MAGRVGELTAHGSSMDNRPQLLQAVASSQAMTAQVVCSASSLSIVVLLLLLVLKDFCVQGIACHCSCWLAFSRALSTMPQRRAVAIKCITLYHPCAPYPPYMNNLPLSLPLLPGGDPIHLPFIHPTLLLFKLTRSDKLPCTCFLPHACLFPFSTRCCWFRVGRARQPCR